MQLSDLIVPSWYSSARQNGHAPEMLRERVREFCLFALQERARKRGDATLPQNVSDSVVSITVNMYEEALAEHQ